MCQAGQAANLAEVYYYNRILPRSISLSWMLEMRLEYAYADDPATRRRNGSPESNFESFRTLWGQRNIVKRLVGVLEGFATCEYRLSIIDLTEGRQMQGFVRLLSAAAAQSQWCTWHLRRLAKKMPHPPKWRFKAPYNSSDANSSMNSIIYSVSKFQSREVIKQYHLLKYFY
jgi:hypothetical protein